MTIAALQRRFTPDEVMNLLPGAVFSWYALQVIGGQESSAAAHLAGRRFGVYLPLEVFTEIGRNQARKVTRALFPGYLFIATPDVKAHHRRIVGTPGAIDLLGDDAPREITPEEIHRIRVVENIEFSRDAVHMQAVYKGRKRRRRRSRRARIGRAIDRQRQISVLAEQLGLHATAPDGLSRLEGRGSRVGAVVPRTLENP